MGTDRHLLTKFDFKPIVPDHGNIRGIRVHQNDRRNIPARRTPGRKTPLLFLCFGGTVSDPSVFNSRRHLWNP